MIFGLSLVASMATSCNQVPENAKDEAQKVISQTSKVLVQINRNLIRLQNKITALFI